MYVKKGNRSLQRVLEACEFYEFNEVTNLDS